MTKLWVLGQLAIALSVAGSAIATSIPSMTAQASEGNVEPETNTVERLGPEAALPPFSHLPIAPPPATTVEEWIAQIDASLTQITGVRVEETEAGLQLVLEIAEGDLPTPATQTVGNALIAEIPNAVLALPDGNSFEQFAPAEGIALVSVTNEPGDLVRVAITGTDAPPVAEVTATGLAVTLGDTVVGAEDEAIQVLVTGEQDEGYNPSSATTATRTDTPLRDIPQSIQVVPQQVLQDQQAYRLDEALRNVPGVTRAFSGPFSVSTFTIRGFTANENSGNNFLRNGLPDPTAGGVLELPGIEQVEVLRGPASVLFGFGNPGGTINLVTKQPLSEPFYEVEATIGNYDFYRGAIDLSGPLNDSGTVLYRLNSSYRNSGYFVDFFDSEYFGISPVVSFNLNERTSLALDGEFVEVSSGNYSGVPLSGILLSNPNGEIPRNRNYAEPFSGSNQKISGIGYRLEHQFSDTWTLRNTFRASFRRYYDNYTIPTGGPILDGRTLNRFYREFELNQDTYALTTDFVGSFSTGSIQHEFTVGLDLNRFTQQSIGSNTATQIDLFNPVYNQPLGPLELIFEDDAQRNSLGIYIQDQVILAENLRLLLGLRFDTFGQDTLDLFADTEINQSGNAFSPRVGIVYQPIPPVSLYASYSRSFAPPSVGTDINRTPFLPERGTQYEFGVKTDLSDRLSATLAFYDLTRTNVLTTDLIDPRFSVQTGEQRSRGIEFTIGGEILPGWNIIGGYAYTNAEVTQDNTPELIGNQLNNTPRNAFNLWTTYEIQAGDLQGLGLGLGLFFVGDRQGDLANTFKIPSYLRTDAAIFYSRNRFRAAINFKNLFDVDFFDFALNRNRLSYGEPFTVQGTISWEF
ncbi:TonB-dependent siderophore receptor [Nodosilinea sp. LEGE 06152]|uniref:TonB-dependent siderophore receptor n=1 Tax=Nodosilinea sp. LEGE 06152 TaxID=2777966 RepID=UPI001882A488|nr:TonB-dependent siderophore receptor [Nodosilinea sp. LEGE 06152]MBE9156978.1 TonB-dependent siderophore receptor [Nodosilinea sp. LEGE 06152]